MYKEIKESGAVKLPRKLMGTTAEKTAFVTTGLPVGSTWSETDATTKKVLNVWEWNGEDWYSYI